MLILYNARIYTQDSRRPEATALAVRDGRILAVGEQAEIRARFEQTPDGPARTFDLEGCRVIPGLTDAHIHLENYALGLRKVDCETEDRAECQRRVKERARKTPAGEWVQGHGWNQNLWAEGFGDPRDLDAAVPDHPVYLTAKSLHAAWANGAALRRAKITAETPDPPGGRLDRDASGRPTGILFESAMDLVVEHMPQPTVEQVAAAIAEAQPVLWRMGLTGAHDFDRRRCFLALQDLHKDGLLGLRVVKNLPVELADHAVGLGLQSGLGDDFLRVGSLKAFADGALGPHTAAMLEPYEDEPDNRGILMLDAEHLVEIGRPAVESGLSLTVHAIGDRANHEVLNAFARLREYEKSLGGGREPLRHRIEHVQIIHPQDAGRLAELGVIASMQPIHAPSDMPVADRWWGERAAYSYAWRTQLEHGAVLAFGSDAPVESPNPFWGLHAAVTRRRGDGAPGPEGWYPEQRLSLAEALRGFTTGAAYAAGLEDRLGRLAPGYLADLLVLDRDLFEVDPEEIRSLRPVATMVDGEFVYSEL